MRGVQWGWTCLLALTAAAAVAGQGKGKPTTDTTLKATAEFRCVAGAGADDQRCASPSTGTDATVDRGRDDGDSYAYYSLMSGKQGLLTNKTGAFIESNGMFSVRVAPDSDGRRLRVLLGTPLEYQGQVPLPCQDTGNCHPVPLTEQSLLLGDAQFRTKPVLYNQVTQEWEDRPNGFFSLPCDGTPSASIVDYTFPDAGGNGHWGLNFNPRGPAVGSTMAEVTRTGPQEWYVRAAAGHVAELIGYNHSGIRGKQGPSREGRYQIPLEIRVTTPGNLSCP